MYVIISFPKSVTKVPDRGGRPSEQQPPPPEMPSWQQTRTGKFIVF